MRIGFRPSTLTGHRPGCLSKYAPWLRVRFRRGNRTVERCAYQYGTLLNSLASAEDANDWLEDLGSPAVGDSLKVLRVG